MGHLPRGSAEATAAATDEDAENDEEEKAAKDEDPLRLQTAFPCRNHSIRFIPIDSGHNRIKIPIHSGYNCIKRIRYTTTLLFFILLVSPSSSSSVVLRKSVLVEAAFHLLAQFVFSIAWQRFPQRPPNSVQQLLQEVFVHIGITCFIRAGLLGGDLNSLPVACPKNHGQGKDDDGEADCRE